MPYVAAIRRLFRLSPEDPLAEDTEGKEKGPSEGY
jgi:hypothetical protein